MKDLFGSKFIIFIIFLVLTVFVYCFSLRYIDVKVNDKFIKMLTYVKNSKNNNDVVLVVIDDKSVSKIPWPWTKNLYSNIFDFLENDAGAKVIVFDNLILFPDTYNLDSDIEFYNRLKNQKKLINSYVLLNSPLSGEILPKEYKSIFDLKNNIKIIDERVYKKTPAYKAVIKLPKEYLENTNNLAASILPEDDDGIVRSAIPVVKLEDKFYPSLALKAYSAAVNQNEFVLTDNYLCSNDDCKTLKIPLTYRKITDYMGNSIYSYQTFYDWYKPIKKYYSHKTYSAYDVLKSYENIKNGEEPVIDLNAFKDKIVIVGLNADNNIWEQWSETPVSAKTADIDVLATTIDNMLNNSFRTLINKDFTIVITFVFCMFVIRGFRRFSYNLLFAGILSLIYLLYYVYEYINGIYISSITPVITIFFVAVFKHIYSIVTVDKTTEMIKNAMGKYLSKDVYVEVEPIFDSCEYYFIMNLTDIAKFYAIKKENSVSIVIQFDFENKKRQIQIIPKEEFINFYKLKENN